jgi:surface antigen
MTFSFPNRTALLRAPAILAVMLLCSACASTKAQMNMFEPEPDSTQANLDAGALKSAISNAKTLRAKGKKVWCVPFARDASGVEIRGNAGTWWDKAANQFSRGHNPLVGAVMAFSSTRKLPMGHVAVVSEVVSDREILIDHANWRPSQVSLGMKVVDVSKKGDWSLVRVASSGDTLGRAYPIDGFIWKTSVQ